MRDCYLPQQGQYECKITGNMARQRIDILWLHTSVGKGSTSALPGECLVIFVTVNTP